MAIRVIRHGAKRTVECPNCTCLFEYEKEDIKSNQTGINEYERIVVCPDCMKEIRVGF